MLCRTGKWLLRNVVWSCDHMANSKVVKQWTNTDQCSLIQYRPDCRRSNWHQRFVDLFFRKAYEVIRICWPFLNKDHWTWDTYTICTGNYQNKGNTWVNGGYKVYWKPGAPHRCGSWVNKATNLPSCLGSFLKMLGRPLFWSLFWLPWLCPHRMTMPPSTVHEWSLNSLMSMKTICKPYV